MLLYYSIEHISKEKKCGKFTRALSQNSMEKLPLALLAAFFWNSYWIFMKSSLFGKTERISISKNLLFSGKFEYFFFIFELLR